MGKIEEEVEKVKQKQWSEEHNKDSAYWKEKARLIKQKEVKEQKEKARESFAPTPQQAAGAPKTFSQKATGFLKERSVGIAHEMQDVRPRKQNYGGSVMGGGDPFGMGQMGNPFAPSRPEPAPRRPRRKKAKKQKAAPRRRSQPRQSSGGGMMGIPKDLRWMF